MKDKREGGGISLLISKYLLVVFIISMFLFSTYFEGIFCGWMPEFEDKAIKLLRSTEPTTLTPTLMLLQLKIYIFLLFKIIIIMQYIYIISSGDHVSPIYLKYHIEL